MIKEENLANGQPAGPSHGRRPLLRACAPTLPHFERHVHTAWRPRHGSMVNPHSLTSAMIDSRDFLAAKKRADNQVLLPTGPKVGLTGGLDFNDQRLIWAKYSFAAARADRVEISRVSPIVTRSDDSVCLLF